MNILITGGTGFIGSHLIQRLLTFNHEIILLKRSNSNTWRIKDFLNKIKVYDIDILDDFNQIFAKNKIDLIIHLSGMYVKYHKDSKEIGKMNLININIPAKLLDSAAKFGVRAFINTGTFFEYKQIKEKMSENSQIEPFDYYATTKLAFEQILKYFAIQKHIRAVTLKLFSPYGEKDNEKIIPLIIKSFIRGKKLSLTKGEQKLSFTYEEDIIEAYLNTIEFITSLNYSQYENFNIGSNKAYTVKQIIQLIRKIAKKKNHIILGALSYQKKEMMCAICDNKKAKEILGWYPKTDIFTGLKKTYHYYLNAK